MEVTNCAPDRCREVLAVYLDSVCLSIRRAVPALCRAGRGRVGSMSSTASLQGYGGLPANIASKWGVRRLTKAAALDLVPFGIRVVSRHPGPICIAMTASLFDEVAQVQPIPPVGKPEEVARMARFHFTEVTDSTGSEFVVDGGVVTGLVLPLPEA